MSILIYHIYVQVCTLQNVDRYRLLFLSPKDIFIYVCYLSLPFQLICCVSVVSTAALYPINILLLTFLCVAATAITAIHLRIIHSYSMKNIYTRYYTHTRRGHHMNSNLGYEYEYCDEMRCLQNDKTQIQQISHSMCMYNVHM